MQAKIEFFLRLVNIHEAALRIFWRVSCPGWLKLDYRRKVVYGCISIPAFGFLQFLYESSCLTLHDQQPQDRLLVSQL